MPSEQHTKMFCTISETECEVEYSNEVNCSFSFNLFDKQRFLNIFFHGGLITTSLLRIYFIENHAKTTDTVSCLM